MASNNVKWYRKVLGNELIDCKSLSNDNSPSSDKNVIPIDVVFEKYGEDCTKLVIGLFFTPSEGVPDECTNYLIQLYHLINYKNDKSSNSNSYREDCEKLLEVIQVFLTNSVHWLDRCTVDEGKVFGQLKEFPWYAIPVKDKDRMIRLTRRYEMKSPTPSLILLDGQTGEIITKHGRERLLQDPSGSEFPWKPRPLQSILEDVELLPGGKSDLEEPALFKNFKSYFIAFYFSAHWCPPCKGFTPQLIETYKRVKSKGVNFEIIFVSSDRSSESFQTYLGTMPWLGIPYKEEECRRDLASLFGVQGIPTLIVVDVDGSVVTYDGRGEVNDDPTGRHFPWRQRRVNLLTERQTNKLQDTPAVVLFIEGDDTEMEFARAVLTPAANEFHEKRQNDEMPLEFFIGRDSDAADSLREFIGIDDAVPLLTLINIPEGNYSVLEDGAEITEETVKQFVHKFLNNELAMQSICNNQRTYGNV